MTKILELDGFKYSISKFENYTNRGTLEIKTIDGVYILDIYTTDPDKVRCEYVLLKHKSDNVIAMSMVHWTTKEADKAFTEFLNEFFK